VHIYPEFHRYACAYLEDMLVHILVSIQLINTVKMNNLKSNKIQAITIRVPRDTAPSTMNNIKHISWEQEAVGPHDS
jgi:hypothetical protein